MACDGLYLKNINWLKKQNINVIYKYFEILYVYNFFDRAFSLLENFKKEKFINNKHYFFLKNQFELKNKKPFYKIICFKFIRKIKFIIFIINHLCKKHLPLIIKNLVCTNKSWHNYQTNNMLREIKTILKKFDFFINLNNYYKKFTKKLPNTVKISLKEKLEQIEKLKKKEIYYIDKKLIK